MFAGPYTCEDGTQGELADDGVGWGPRGPAIDGGQLGLSENWGSVAFDVSGHLGTRGGSGTLTVLMAALTADEQPAQVCTLGEVTWTVERTSEEDLPYRPIITSRGASGGSTAIGYRATTPEGATRPAGTEVGSIRRYRGRTSQGRGMAARTSRVDTGIAMSISHWSTCSRVMTGPRARGGIRPLAYFDATQVMPPGRLDLDVAPRMGLGLGLACHLHGELDAHGGSGTLAMMTASLTDDRHAQLCTSGD